MVWCYASYRYYKLLIKQFPGSRDHPTPCKLSGIYINMRKLSIIAALAICSQVISVPTFAGNKDRNGQAGASEMSINPWGKSTGVFGLNTSYVGGIDALKTNVAGLGDVETTEVGVSYSAYLRGSGIGVNNLGFAQRLGDFGVLGVNVMSMSFGEITMTDYDNPGGNIGTYTPQFFNIMLGYSKEFTDYIQAGVGVTLISEQITNVKANGATFEAGIQYKTGKRDNFHFGITLRNIGTNMRFSGNGFAINSEAPENSNYSLNRSIPSEKFEMPTYLNFGAAYDFYLDEKKGVRDADVQSTDAFVPKHRLTVMAAFTSNSFNSDFFGIGAEYSFNEMFMLRGAYRYESGITDTYSTTFYTGVSAGATVQKQLGDSGPTLALDYSYRPTQRPANGVHVFSLRFMR